MTHLGALDVTLIALYFVIVFLIGWWVSRSIKGGEDLFLAGRTLGAATIGFSLFASNISSTTLIGVTGQAYSTGISVANYELVAGMLLAVMALTTIPVYLRLKITTVPEYFGRRFGPVARKYFSALTIFLTVFVDMAASVYAGVVVLQAFFPSAPFIPLCIGLAVFAGLYTAAGGLRAVVYTDVMQAVILLVGAAAIAFSVYGEFDFNWDNATRDLPEGHMSLIRPANDGAVPWTGLVIGLPVLGWFYWSMNQYVVQRVLAARSEESARKGALLAAGLKVLPLFLLAMPGAFAFALLPGLENSDLVFPTLIAEFLPAGLKGLVIAGLIAAIMSTVDSTLNSASTLVLYDFAEVEERHWTPEKIMMIGRFTTAGLIIIAALWPVVIREFPGVFSYIQQVFGYAVPPVVAVFLMGMFWRKMTGRAAMTAMITGHALGLSIFLWRAFHATAGTDDGLPHFTVVAGLTVPFCAAIATAVSLSSLRFQDPASALTCSLSDFGWGKNAKTLSATLVLIALVGLTLLFR